MWTLYVLATVVLWGITDIFYKKGADKEDRLMPFKFSVSIGLVFFVIAIYYISIREETFTIWESAVRYWPMTLFGILYAIVNTISFHGFMYNEASIVAPVENIASGSYVILLVCSYIALGRVDSVWDVLSVYKVAGIALVLLGLLALCIVQNRETKRALPTGANVQKQLFKAGASALIFPILFSFMDGLETLVSGICLNKSLGYAMPEGDGIIIVGMEYAVFAFAFWLYVNYKEKHIFSPFSRKNLPLVGGALCDNLAIVFYAYAMAIDAVATDPILIAYPVVTIFLSKIILKEKLSLRQYLCLALILCGSIVIVIGQNL